MVKILFYYFKFFFSNSTRFHSFISSPEFNKLSNITPIALLNNIFPLLHVFNLINFGLREYRLATFSFSGMHYIEVFHFTWSRKGDKFPLNMLTTFQDFSKDGKVGRSKQKHVYLQFTNMNWLFP